MKRALVNPLILFLAVWSTVFVLFSFHLSTWLVELDPEFIVFALATGLAAIGGATCAYHLTPVPRHPTTPPTSDHARLLRTVKFLFALMCIIFPIEVYVSGGMPIFWLFTGSAKNYTDYGIPTVHGFFNAIMLFEGTVCFWLMTSTRSSKLIKFIFLCCLMLPIAAITRQVVMSLLAQCFVVFVGSRLRGRRVNFVRVFAIVAISLVLFSLIGIFRTNSEAFRQQVALNRDYNWVPVAFLWPYMYFTTPINNFAYITTLQLSPMLGYSSFSSLTPTVIRELIWGVQDKNSMLVVATFNVTSYASPLYLDFGWPGVVVFTFLLIFVSVVFFRKLKQTNSLYYLLLLSIFDHIIILSFFFNFLLTWGVIFQLIILLLIRKRVINVAASGNRKPKLHM